MCFSDCTALSGPITALLSVFLLQLTTEKKIREKIFMSINTAKGSPSAPAKAGKLQNLHISEIAQGIAEASLANTPNPPVKYVGLKWFI